MSTVMFKTIPANLFRGIVGAIALVLIGIGTMMLWGWGGFFAGLGVVLFVDLAVDEAIERITLTKRGMP